MKSSKSFRYVLALTGLSILLQQPAQMAFARDDEQQIFKLFADSATNIMGKCGQRIWPGYSWGKMSVMLVGEGNNSKIAVSPNDGKVHQVPIVNVPDAAQMTTFNFFHRFRSKWMSLNSSYLSSWPPGDPQALAESLFGLGVHEAFHNIVQPKWTVPPTRNGQRGTDFPIQAQPRIERRMLFDQLKQAFLHPENAQQALAKASFWFHKWQAEYPREVAATTDGYEGTARYSEYMGMTLMHLGCSATEYQLRDEIIAKFDQRFGFFENGQYFALDSEGYDIGGLSGLILRFQFPNRNWWAEVSAGATPVQILLGDVPPQHEDADPAIVQTFEAKQVELQQTAQDLIAGTITAMTDPKAVIVALPYSWQNGSYSPIAFYIDAASDLSLTPLAEPINFVSQDSGSKVIAKDHAVLVSGSLASPCSQSMSYWTLTVPMDSLVQRDSVFNVNGDRVSGYMRGELKKAVDGKSWLCGI